MILVDTNILIDVLDDDPQWADWSIQQLHAQAQVHELAINPVIYAELAACFKSIEALDRAVAGFGVTMLELPKPALFLAAQAFLRYRRKGGAKHNVLADFFIGAQASVLGCPLLTRDTGRYRTYFPKLQLIAPDAH